MNLNYSFVMKFFIIFTHFAQVVLFGLLFYFGYGLYLYNEQLSKTKAMVATYQCDNRIAVSEKSQYSDYWVLWNYVKPELREKFCRDKLTIALQGNPHDIYYLVSLYKCSMKDTRISFAVYVNSTEDMNDAIAAIHYVHSCIYFIDYTKSSVRAEYLFARDQVSFHLYFRLGLLDKLPLIANMDFLLNQPVDCLKYTIPERDVMQSDSYKIDRHVIIGKNIAQLAAITRFLLHLDTRTWPVENIATRFKKEINAFIAAGDNLPDMDNVIYRLPLLIIENMKHTALQLRVLRLPVLASDSKAASEKDEIFVRNLPQDSGNFIVNKTTDIYPVYTKLKLLISYMSYFITYSNGPLYDDREGLNLRQSENLRISRYALRKGHVIALYSPFLLHNVTSTEVTVDNFIESRNFIKTIANSTIAEYFQIFG